MSLTSPATGAFTYTLPAGFDDTKDFSVRFRLRRAAGTFGNAQRFFTLQNAAGTRGFIVASGASSAAWSVDNTRLWLVVGDGTTGTWGDDVTNQGTRGKIELGTSTADAWDDIAFVVRGTAAGDNTGAGAGVSQVHQAWFNGVEKTNFIANVDTQGFAPGAASGGYSLLGRVNSTSSYANGAVADVTCWQDYRFTAADVAALFGNQDPATLQPAKILFSRNYRTALAAQLGDTAVSAANGTAPVLDSATNPPAYASAPNAPSGISAGSITSSSAVIAIANDNSSDETGFEFALSTTSNVNGSGIVASVTGPANNLSNTVSGLTASTNYFPMARALKAGSSPSTWVVGAQFTTSAATTYTTPVLSRPASGDIDLVNSTITNGTSQNPTINLRGDPETNSGQGDVWEALYVAVDLNQIGRNPTWTLSSLNFRQPTFPVAGASTPPFPTTYWPHWRYQGETVDQWKPFDTVTLSSGTPNTLTFGNNAAFAQRNIEVSLFPPVTYQDIIGQISTLRTSYPTFVTETVKGAALRAANPSFPFGAYYDFPDQVSPDGVSIANVYALAIMITNPAALPVDGSQKRNIVLNWIHSGEMSGLHFIRLLLNQIVAGTALGNAILRNYNIMIPWMSTDGLVGGLARGGCEAATDTSGNALSTSGQDKNRAWPDTLADTIAKNITPGGIAQAEVPSVAETAHMIYQQFGLTPDNTKINCEGGIGAHSAFNAINNFINDFSSGMTDTNNASYWFATQFRSNVTALGDSRGVGNLGDPLGQATDARFRRTVTKGQLWQTAELGYATKDYLTDIGRAVTATLQTLDWLVANGKLPTPVVGDVISISGIQSGRVYQRAAGSTSRQVAFAGTYTGSPTAIQARVVDVATSTALQGLDWQTVVSAPAGGAYSASLTVPQGGDYRIEVRFSNATTVTAVSPSFSVGIILLAYGGTNALALATETASPAAASSGIKVFKAGAWGAPSANGEIALLNRLRAVLSAPVALVAQGSNNALSVDLAPGGALYTSMQSMLATIGNDVEVLMLQSGEADLFVIEADYKSRMSAIYDGMKTITGRSSSQLKALLAQMGVDASGSGSPAAWSALRKWQWEWGSTVSGAYLSHAMIDLPVVAGGHKLTPAACTEQGDRFGRAVAYALGLSVARPFGPSVAAVYRNGAAVTVLLSHAYGTALQDLSGSETGFEVSKDDFATILPVSSVAVVQPDRVVINLASDPAASVKVRYGYGRTPDMSQPVYDNAA